MVATHSFRVVSNFEQWLIKVNDEGSNGGKWYMKMDISLKDNHMNIALISVFLKHSEHTYNW